LAILSETIAAIASPEQGARASGMCDRIAGYRSCRSAIGRLSLFGRAVIAPKQRFEVTNQG
jgi:hypothetical protein